MTIRRFIGLIVYGAALILFFSTSIVFAQSSTPREDTWVTDGTVETIVRTTGTVYIGGEFTYVGATSPWFPQSEW